MTESVDISAQVQQLQDREQFIEAYAELVVKNWNDLTQAHEPYRGPARKYGNVHLLARAQGAALWDLRRLLR